MNDEDLCCKDCLGEAVRRRFLFYPCHETAKVIKLPEGYAEVCDICRKGSAVFAVSIVLASLRKDLVLKEDTLLKSDCRKKA